MRLYAAADRAQSCEPAHSCPDDKSGGKLTVEGVLPPHHQGELEGVPAISRVDSNSVDVWAGV